MLTWLAVLIFRLLGKEPKPAPEKAVEYHALFGDVPAFGGCSGVETCFVCTSAVAQAVEKLPPGQCYLLPSSGFDLLVWADGSYSLMPALRSELN